VILWVAKWMLTGSWLAIILFPLAFWTFNSNSFHDASHFAFIRDWRINRLMGWTAPYLTSPVTWDFQHVISHHNLCNTMDDPDSHYMPRRPHLYRRAWLLKFLLMTWGLQFMFDTRSWIKLQFHHTQMIPHVDHKRRVFHFLTRPIWYFFSLTWPFFLCDFGIIKSLLFAAIPWAIYGFCFGICSQLSHLQDGLEVELDLRGKSWKWHQHQCSTTVNYGGGPFYWFFFWFSGGLSNQIEHHLYPGYNHCQLRRLAPGVKRICEKHGVPYRHMEGMINPLKAHIDHMSRIPETADKEH